MGLQHIRCALAVLAFACGSSAAERGLGRGKVAGAQVPVVEAPAQGLPGEDGTPTASGVRLHLVQTPPQIPQPAQPPPEVAGAKPQSLAPLVQAVRPTVVGVTTRVSAHGGAGADELWEHFFGGPPPKGDTPEQPFGGAPPEGSPFDEGPPGKGPFGGPPGEGRGVGSGVVIDPQGLVLTNYHVVEGAEEVRVRTDNNQEYQAEVIGRDPETDLAVLKLKSVKQPLPAARLGSSAPLQVGDPVMAIGNPFGLDFSVTTGIISAKAREIGAGPFDDFLQTDAAINPGNSGGPLFDLQGNVVGINTAIVAGGTGIGFAVPIDLVKALLPQMVEKGEVVRGFLGVGIQDLTADLGKALDIPATQGAVVASVDPKGPAGKSDLKPGDVVVSLNGKPVTSAAQLSREVSLLKPRQPAKMEVLRGGKRQELEVTLGTRPTSRVARRVEERPRQSESETGALGLALQPAPPELSQKAGVKGGAVVVDVTPGSPAEHAGLQPGDLIVEVNRRAVGSPQDVARTVREGRKEQLLLRVMRGSTGLFVVVPQPSLPKGQARPAPPRGR